MSAVDATGGFGGRGAGAERKAAGQLKALATFAALRTILNECAGYDNEGGSALSHPLYRGLQQYASENPLRDADVFMEGLLSHPDAELRLAAVRMLEVRLAFARDGFDWEQLRNFTVGGLEADNRRLKGEFLTRSLEGTAEEPADA